MEYPIGYLQPSGGNADRVLDKEEILSVFQVSLLILITIVRLFTVYYGY